MSTIVYDWRKTKGGRYSSKTADDNILSNLRSRWKEQAAHMDDEDLLNLYDDFSLSEDFGDNDEKFPEWLESAK